MKPMGWPACLAFLVVAALGAAGPATAQDPGDEQTRDHEREDSRYLERLGKTETPKPATDTPQPAAPGSRREAFLAQAERLIRDRNFKSATSEHYRVETDDPNADARAAADLLESFRAFFESFASADIALEDYEATGRVFLFWSFQKFDQVVTGDWRFSDVRPDGHYRTDLDVLTLHTDPDGPPGGQADALVHEAAHQLVNQRIFGGQDPSRWVAEGLATYFGFTLQDARGFQAGAIGGKAVSLIKDQRPGGAEEARERLRRLRRALKEATPEDRSPFMRVLEVDDPGAFYGSDPELNYSASWILVHYLLHADGGRHRPAFVRHLERERTGGASAEALYGDLGMSATQLHAALADHAKRLDVR
jgi:hypothetical protein